jgi:repressor LexA
MSANFSTLTAKQKKVFSAIETYINLKGIPPTVREIGEMVGEKTPGAVQGILNRLEQKGVIKRQLGAARSIQLVSSDNQMYATPVYIPEIKR